MYQCDLHSAASFRTTEICRHLHILYMFRNAKNVQVRLCSGCTPWLHPTPEYMSVSFSDWPTFTHTWVITDLLSDKDLLSFPRFWGNKFDYLVFCCYYFHRHPFPVQCNCVSVSRLWQQVMDSHKTVIWSYRLWTAWEVCGAIYCHKEANQSPRSGTGFTFAERRKQGVLWCPRWETTGDKTCNRRYAVLWISFELDHKLEPVKCFQWPATLQQDGHNFRFNYNYF